MIFGDESLVPSEVAGFRLEALNCYPGRTRREEPGLENELVDPSLQLRDAHDRPPGASPFAEQFNGVPVGRAVCIRPLEAEGYFIRPA